MINSKKAALAILGGLLLIGSCASEPKWTKPGVTAEQLKQDKARCTREELRGSRAYGGAYRVKVVNRACMEALGYIRR